MTDKNMLTEPVSIFSAATDATKQQDNVFQNAEGNKKTMQSAKCSLKSEGRINTLRIQN